MTVESPFEQQSFENGAEKRPLLSIVTIAKNNAASFINTMHSLMAQFKANPHLRDQVQVIVINGSTEGYDGIAMLMAKYAKFINIAISEEDDGIYDAMNKGLDHATGE